MPSDFRFHGSIEDYDPDLSQLIGLEDQRQREKVILIPSESIAPEPVCRALGSNFGNIYAEGYPRPDSRQQSESEILDVAAELAHFRRNSDPRYYKGVEYADILEALARRRAAELFATNDVTADELFVNVQPLSGSPANMAVYGALLEAGDTIMGLDLIHGGHLTHGSKVSRSGKQYNIVAYGLDEETDSLDYDDIEALAMEAQPKLIVAGFTAYSLIIDWKRFRSIADKCGAYLMADIAHICGLVAAGVHPSPVGIADVVTTTTHKSLCGPRGAMILTHKAKLAREIDRSVFPGEQGGPHLNTIAALAIALKLAKSDEFKALMSRVIENASYLANSLADKGLRIVSGRSENHLLMIDTKTIEHDGVYLSGDMAARILDVAGLVTNRNTIPGDKSAFSATGVRIGTVWISQLGYGKAEMELLADAISTVLHGCKPFYYLSRTGRKLLRAKVESQTLQKCREIVEHLTKEEVFSGEGNTLLIRGERAEDFLDMAVASDVKALLDEQSQQTIIFGPESDYSAVLRRQNHQQYHLQFTNPDFASRAALWFQDLSDGYVRFDGLLAKLPGPVVVESLAKAETISASESDIGAIEISKPYFIGIEKHSEKAAELPPFQWEEPDEVTLQKTTLHETHVRSGARMVPFAGWDMPVWYTSVSDEHAAVRNSAGLFDVSHMGVFEAAGPHAANFLDIVTANDVKTLPVGRSHYTFFLLPSGEVVDDLLVYRRSHDKYLLVVNAANNDKDWSWLNAVNSGKVSINDARPWSKILHPCELRDLRDPQWKNECLVDIALQGPKSRDILLSICADDTLAKQIETLLWAGLIEGNLAGFEVVISRTGYTGERIGFEIFVHPDQAPDFWNLLMEAGEPFGLKPCGLASRDSTRTEAGLPLYGHELAGPLNLNPADAGFGRYVKLWKPFFIGREPFINHEKERNMETARFRMNEKAVRRPELGDPVLDRRGKIIGTVSSCAIDAQGYLTGLAYLPIAFIVPGTELAIYQTGGGQRKIRIPDDFDLGKRLPVPDRATVLTRFPKRK